MNSKTVFERGINYIDENITKNYNGIIAGLVQEIGFSVNKFGNYFHILTGQTLKSYIRERRLYWAAWELKYFPEKSIAEIALSYGYSEQSALTRAISSYFNATPTDIRNSVVELKDNKASYHSVTNPSHKQSTLDHIMDTIESQMGIGGYAVEIISRYSDAQSEYPFPPEVLSAIFDLAEMMKVPAELLLDACFDVYTEVQANPDNYVLDGDYEVASAIGCGIKTEEELYEICQYYGCAPVDLDCFCVEAYRNRKLDESPLTDSEDNYVDPA